MTTNGIASTALDFLATIDSDDSVWDDDGIEGFVQQFQSLATKKRHEREQSRINRAIETLRAQIESLPDGEFEIDLGAFVSADVPAIDIEAVLSRIQAMTEAVTTYRQEATRTTDGTSLTIAERAATYHALGTNLSRIMQLHASLLELAPSAVQTAIPAEVYSLKKHIKSIAYKKLSDVEIRNSSSNQHEFNGIDSFIKLLGKTSNKVVFETRFLYLSDNLDNVSIIDASMTWYDARANHLTRTEYRLYYPDATISRLAAPGDLLVIAKLLDNKLLAIIASKKSKYFKTMLSLTGSSEDARNLSEMRINNQFQEAPFDNEEKLVLRAVNTAIKSFITGCAEVV